MTAQQIHAIMQKHAPDAVPEGLVWRNKTWWVSREYATNSVHIDDEHAERLCIAELVEVLAWIRLEVHTYRTGRTVVTHRKAGNERRFVGRSLLEALAKAYTAVKEKD